MQSQIGDADCPGYANAAVYHRLVKVVVTGGAGFIGANLCRHLLSAPGVQEVVAFDNLSNGRLMNLDSVPATFVEGDITSPSDLDKVCDNASSIVHLAALGSVPRSIEFPEATHHNNATGTLEVLRAAQRAGDAHTIVASSSSVYGATEELPKHEGLPTRPISPYAVSKVATENYAIAFQQSMGLPTLAFRFFNVFGPLQPADHIYAAVIPLFLNAALAGRPVTVFGDGLQSRDFTYVDTVCETLTRAVVEKTTHDTPVNLAFGDPITILDVVEKISELLGTPVEVEHDPPRPGDLRHSDADSGLLYDLFPGTTPTPFVEGLRATIDWFRSQ